MTPQHHKVIEIPRPNSYQGIRHMAPPTNVSTRNLSRVMSNTNMASEGTSSSFGKTLKSLEYLRTGNTQNSLPRTKPSTVKSNMNPKFRLAMENKPAGVPSQNSFGSGIGKRTV